MNKSIIIILFLVGITSSANYASYVYSPVNFCIPSASGICLPYLAPNVTYLSSNTSIIFQCGANATQAFRNVSLWIDAPPPWYLNQSQSITGTSNSTNFTVNLSAGTYTWDCEWCIAANDKCVFSPNQTLNILGGVIIIGGGGGGGGAGGVCTSQITIPPPATANITANVTATPSAPSGVPFCGSLYLILILLVIIALLEGIRRYRNRKEKRKNKSLMDKIRERFK